MKFNASPKGKDVTATALTIGGAFAGGMASRGAVTLLPVSGKTDEATLKKEKNIKMIVRGVLIAGGIYAAAAIEGNDETTAALKGAAAGTAIIQIADLVKDLAENSPSIKRGAEATTKTQKFLAASLGLACPCTDGLNGNAAYAFLNGRRSRRAPRLRYADTSYAGQLSNPWQEAIHAGQNEAAYV